MLYIMQIYTDVCVRLFDYNVLLSICNEAGFIDEFVDSKVNTCTRIPYSENFGEG